MLGSRDVEDLPGDLAGRLRLAAHRLDRKELVTESLTMDGVMSWPLVAVAIAAGCGSDPDCSFDHVVEEAIHPADLADCGYPVGAPFEAPTDLTPWRVSHDCAIASSAAQQPFIVRWLVPSVEGATRYALVGGLSQSRWSLALFEEGFNADATTRPTVEYACELHDRGACADVAQTLCLDCGARAITEECGGQ